MRMSDWSADVCSSDLIFETGDDRADERQVFEQRAFGELDLELAWWKAGFDEQLDQLLAEPGVLQLLGRDVDRERDRRVPALGDFKGVADAVKRTLAGQPACLCDRNA